MSSLKDEMEKALNPGIAVKLINITGNKPCKTILEQIHHSLKYTYNYQTILDTENGVIYIGKV